MCVCFNEMLVHSWASSCGPIKLSLLLAQSPEQGHCWGKGNDLEWGGWGNSLEKAVSRPGAVVSVSGGVEDL